MAPRRPAENYDNDEASSNKRPRIEDEGVGGIHLRGGSGQGPSNPVNPPPVLKKPPMPASLLKPPVPSTPSQQMADQPTTPANQRDPSSNPESPQQPMTRTDRVLAVARTSTRCTLAVGTDVNGQPIHEDVVLLLKLQVHTCYVPFETRLGYSAGIFLRRQGPQGLYDQHIGEIGGWRVSKPCRVQPAVDRQYFVRELLRTPLDRFQEQSSWKELSYALRAVYTQGGRPRAAVNAQVRPTLDGDGSDLVFIQMLHIKLSDEHGTVFQGNGFGRLALDMFYRLLTSRLLPAWYAVKTPATFLLVPGVPDGEGARRWEENLAPGEVLNSSQFFDRVEATLANIYNRWGYEFYIRNRRVGTGPNTTFVTVMGHTIDNPVPSDPNDRLRRVSNRTAQAVPQFSSPADSPMRRRQLPASQQSSDDNDFSQILGQTAASGPVPVTGTGSVQATTPLDQGQGFIAFSS